MIQRNCLAGSAEWTRCVFVWERVHVWVSYNWFAICILRTVGHYLFNLYSLYSLLSKLEDEHCEGFSSLLTYLVMVNVSYQLKVKGDTFRLLDLWRDSSQTCSTLLWLLSGIKDSCWAVFPKWWEQRDHYAPDERKQTETRRDNLDLSNKTCSFEHSVTILFEAFSIVSKLTWLVYLQRKKRLAHD